MEAIYAVSWVIYSLLVWISLIGEEQSVTYKARSLIGWAWVSGLFWIVLLGLAEPGEEVYVILAMFFFVLLGWPLGGK